MSSSSGLKLEKFAVKYEPPTLVVEYCNKATGKTFLKHFRLRGKIGVDASRVTDKIIAENHELLGPTNASRDQILSLMQLIIDKSGKSSVSNQAKGSGKIMKDYGDLNKQSDDIVERAKSEMNVDFEANRLTPADEKYVWDKKVDFAPPVGNSDWDDDDD